MTEPDTGQGTRPKHGGNDRAAALAEAILGISESLDLNTVLREIAEGARGLTGARLGIIGTVDEAGVPEDYVFSGFTPEEEQELVKWSGGLALFEHVHELPGPLRVDDLTSYVRELGLPPPPLIPGAFQGARVRYRDASLGYLFLSEKAGGVPFTGADEAVLLLFAAQAATAIGNARAHLSERRARTNLEALVETSPVGVIVFDGSSGQIVSYNREASRIGASLTQPGRALEELLDVVVCRRADGREASLAELPLSKQFAHPETVRAEEMEFSVPGGSSVRTLINSTPIPAEGSASGSVVVTLQDLAPLEETERMRTEFLSLVSHELRAPLTSIKGAAVTLLEESGALDPAEMREFFRIIAEQAGHMRGLIADLLDAGRIDSGTLSVSPERCAVTDLVERARSAFRTGGGAREVVVDLPGGLPPVTADRRRIVQVLNNLLANAARHTHASSAIRVSAEPDGHDVAVSVADDGEGLTPERLGQLFAKHAGGAAGTAGHGLGLSICKGLVEAHGGRIRAESDGPGRGTTITFTLPAAESGDAAPAVGPSHAPDGRTRILALDDDPNALRFVRDALTGAGYEAIMTGEPGDLPGLIADKRPSLVLLDLLLPDNDGLELFQSIPELSDLPVIFISAYGRDETVAKAFDLGADDYIVKPFSPTELIARIGAALRRRSGPSPFVHGDLTIHYESREVTVRGEAVDLTATEFDLLRELSLNAGRVVRHETLLERVWEGRENADANLLRIFVRNVRRKLGDSARNPTWIFTLRRVGYRMPRPPNG